MKYQLLCAILLCSFFYANAFAPTDTSFIMKGNLKGYGDGVIVISYTDPNQKVKPDTIQVVGDKFIFKGELESPLMAYMKILNNGKLDKNYYRIDFLIENSSLSVEGDINNPKTIKISGSKSNDMLKKIRSATNVIVQEYVAAKNARRKADTEEEKETLEKKYVEKREAYTDALLNYEGFYRSHAGAYALWLLSKRLPWEKLDKILPKFDSKLENNTFLKYMKRKVEGVKKILPGKKAMDFVVKDLNGEEYSLEDFKGHYLLMTFSASWCGPCKLEYPFLVKAFNEYAPKGLKVIIINLDVSKELWKGDVEKYNFPFPVLSNLQAFDGSFTKNYGVLSIPKVFLISPDGKIVSSTIRQQKILDKLAETYQ